MGYFDSLRSIEKKKTSEANDDRTWDDLQTDLSLDEDTGNFVPELEQDE